MGCIFDRIMDPKGIKQCSKMPEHYDLSHLHRMFYAVACVQHPKLEDHLGN
mgnify:CR=1 FL=1